MSVDCVAKFNDENTTVTTLVADTEYSGTISNRFEGAYFKFELIENETIFFTLRLQPNTTFAINVAFTLYRKDGETFTNLGTSVCDDFYNTFDYDATPAEYYLCITTDWSIDYTLSGEFTDFPVTLFTTMDAYSGEYTPPVEFARPEAICDSQVFYKIIEGHLPKGLSLDPGGFIMGTPLEQDCEDEAKDLPPSFMWFKDDEETGERVPVSCDYRVVIRAALVEAPETYDDREFVICVHNNWDKDRDAFINSKPYFEHEVYHLKGEEPWNVPAPEPQTPPELPKLDKAVCEPCPEPVEPVQATLEEIKELAKQVYIAPEYRGLIKINDEGLCEVCEEPDEAEYLEIKTIDDIHCEPCPEPMAIEGLQSLPPSLCPCDVETTEVELVDPYVRGIPQNCYPGLLERMMNDKVCDTYHTCEYIEPKYPKLPEKSNGLPSSICEKECD